MSETILKIGLAADHAGFQLKEKVISHLQERGYTTVDYGTNSEDSCDYPDYAHQLGKALEAHDVDMGISICGTGNGIAMTLNKYPNVRAALCWSIDITKLAREHNNANVLSLPARFLSDDEAMSIIDAFFNTGFDGGRHLRRINKIPIVQ